MNCTLIARDDVVDSPLRPSPACCNIGSQYPTYPTLYLTQQANNIKRVVFSQIPTQRKWLSWGAKGIFSFAIHGPGKLGVRPRDQSPTFARTPCVPRDKLAALLNMSEDMDLDGPGTKRAVRRCHCRKVYTLTISSATLAEHERFDATELYHVQIARQAN